MAIVVETRGHGIFIFSFKNDRDRSVMKLFILNKFINNLSSSTKFELGSPKGDLIVDSNSGAIFIKRMTSDGSESVTSIPISSFEELSLSTVD